MSKFGKKYSANLPWNYRLATGEKACGNCDAFKGGYCKMFYMPVEATFVCDEWTDNFKEGT